MRVVPPFNAVSGQRSCPREARIPRAFEHHSEPDGNRLVMLERPVVIPSAHVDSVRSQGADLRRRRGHPRRCRSYYTCRSWFLGCDSSALARASDPGRRLVGSRRQSQGAHQVVAREVPFDAAERTVGSRQQRPSPSCSVARSAWLRRQSARSGRCDGGANRLVARHNPDVGAQNRHRSHDEGSFSKPGWSASRVWNQRAIHRPHRLLGHLLGRVQADNTNRHGHPEAPHPLETRYATCGAANNGAATSAVAPRSRG